MTNWVLPLTSVKFEITLKLSKLAAEISFKTNNRIKKVKLLFRSILIGLIWVVEMRQIETEQFLFRLFARFLNEFYLILSHI